MRLVPMVLLLPLLLTGCGEAGGAPSGRQVPATPAALAYLAAEHVGEPDSADEGSSWGPAFHGRTLQAELRFDSTGEYDGDAVQVVVGRGFEGDPTDCGWLRGRVDGCEEVGDGLLYWGEEEPEEDPGAVIVLQPRGRDTVLVAYYGPTITGDPRDLDLPIDVADLLDVAADRRIDATTDETAVDEGADAPYWQG